MRKYSRSLAPASMFASAQTPLSRDSGVVSRPQPAAVAAFAASAAALQRSLGMPFSSDSTISTRRFICRPSGLSLGATGCVAP